MEKGSKELGEGCKEGGKEGGWEQGKSFTIDNIHSYSIKVWHPVLSLNSHLAKPSAMLQLLQTIHTHNHVEGCSIATF